MAAGGCWRFGVWDFRVLGFAGAGLVGSWASEAVGFSSPSRL